MSRFYILIISILISSLAASAAPDWHDDIVSSMNTADEIDRNIVVNRQSNSRRITNASYRYTFKSRALYKSLRETLLSRESDAATVIIKPGKDGEIIMRFRRQQETRNYRLSTIKKGTYQLVISVNDDPNNDLNNSGSTILQTNSKQAQIIIQNAAKAKENAAKARRNANKTSMTASISRSGTSRTITVGDSNSAEAKAVIAELKAAEQERKRLLDK